MAFNLSEGIQALIAGPQPNRVDNSSTNTQSGVEGLIAQPQFGEFKRKMLQWRVPQIGWVQMFLNPSEMTISDSKDITDVRTKAGFILQYAGEKLTQIRISGTTGSSGIEGINILRAVYRSEQLAFDRIAVELDRTGPIADTLQIAKGLLDSLASSNAGFLGGSASILSDVTQGALNATGQGQSFPTLASLAINVELYFQGEVFRGYFKSFEVTEDANQPGIFKYSLEFAAHSRQGVRRNFMPWHRQPYNPIGLGESDTNPLSFISEKFSPVRSPEFAGQAQAEKLPQNVLKLPKDLKNKRSLALGAGSKGASVSGIDLKELV